MKKNILILKASDDIPDEEITNVVSQITMYGISSTVEIINSPRTLHNVLNSGVSYDYIYLATHGCETSWGNISGTLAVKWMEFAAMICVSGVTKPGAIFLHSCCKGGLNQVAWEMFFCCERISYICGPRHSVSSIDLITVFNLFLYFVEVRRIDPVIAAEKVLKATDIRLSCFDRVETITEIGYQQYCNTIQPMVNQAVENIESPPFVEP